MKSYNHELFSGVCTRPLMWLMESFSRSKKETESMFCVGRKLIHACPWAMVSTTMLRSDAVEMATS